MIRTSIYTLLISLLVSPLSFSQKSTASLVRVPANVFVNKGETTFDSILYVNDSIIYAVEELFDSSELTHEFTLDGSKFSKYWEVFGNQWYWVKIKPNEPPFLLFKGIVSFLDEKEYVEIFDIRKEAKNRIYANSGHLLAYKEHPFTKEIVLFVHEYPCCQSASHNIIQVRYVNDTIRVKKRFFVGRDHNDMVGPFFPDAVEQPKDYKQLTSKITLRWSPEMVTNNAFAGRAKTNVIIHYNEGAVYKVLHQDKGWQFVVMFNGIAEEQSSVLNYTNFINRPVYGWIKSQ
jgi:hypothetical protein